MRTINHCSVSGSIFDITFTDGIPNSPITDLLRRLTEKLLYLKVNEEDVINIQTEDADNRRYAHAYYWVNETE